MSKSHVFSVDDAIKYGVEKAVILQNLRFWLEKVKANDKDDHKHDGYYWTYNSARAFSELFPYFGERKVQRLLTQLENDGVIMSGNYNKIAYDRTKWYSMPEFSIIQNCQMEGKDLSNGNTQSVEPIPDVITDVIADVNLTNVTEKTEADLLVEFWNDNRPANSAVKVKVWSKIIKARLKTFTADEIKQAMLSVINSQWHQQNNQVLIKNAIDSDERCSKALEQAKGNQLQTNHNQVNSNASYQQHRTAASDFGDMLDQQLAAEQQQGERYERTVN